MKRLAAVALFALATLGPFASQPAAAQGVRDDLGREVPVVGAAARLVSLSPFLTEAIAATGGMAQLVAVSEFSNYPPYARTLPTVASSTGIAWEKLIALRPDLAFAWKDSLREGDLERFERAGLKVFVFTGRRLDDVPRTVRTIARVAGRNPPPAAIAFEQRIAELRAANAGKAKLSVFMEISHRPLMTIAGAHFINDALEACGAENPFKGLSGVAPEVSWEQLMAADPRVIVGAGAPGREADFRARWSERATLRAVKQDALVYLDGDHIFRPTPRLAEGVEALCRALEAIRGK